MSENKGPDEVQRDVLPIPDRPYEGLVTYDANDPETSFCANRAAAAAVAAAPNVLVVLIDDCGFGASSAVRGTVLDTGGGAAGCEWVEVQPLPHDSPVLAHTPGAADGQPPPVGMGGITEIATSAPGYNSIRPNSAAPLAETPGSMATRPRSSASVTRCRSGRRACWGRSTPGPPGGGGFEHFYGFIGGETNQYAPALYDGTTPVEPDLPHWRRATTSPRT